MPKGRAAAASPSNPTAAASPSTLLRSGFVAAASPSSFSVALSPSKPEVKKEVKPEVKKEDKKRSKYTLNTLYYMENYKAMLKAREAYEREIKAEMEKEYTERKNKYYIGKWENGKVETKESDNKILNEIEEFIKTKCTEEKYLGFTICERCQKTIPLTDYNFKSSYGITYVIPNTYLHDLVSHNINVEQKLIELINNQI